MRFYEQPIEGSFTYTVDDVFGTIVITSDQKLIGAELDTIALGIMQSGFTGGQIRPGLTFDWQKRIGWLPDEPAPAVTPNDTTGISDKSRFTALLLAICFGGFGAHRFYVGRWKSGLTILLLTISIIGLFVSGLLVIFDILIIASGSFHDAQDRRISKW